MPEVTVNDINLYYETYGEGQPLVFIHGFGVDHLVFSGMPAEYQDSYQVVLLDNRGSGQTDAPDYPYTVEKMADDILEFCRVLKLGPCHFVGHSMGGMILQSLAYRHPQQVRSATLCNIDTQIDIRYALVAKSRLAFMEANCPQRALIENGIGWTFSREFLQRPGMIEDIINIRMANPFPMTVTGYKNQLNALLTFDSHEWVHKIKAPCLVMGSDLDIIAPEPGIRKMAALIPHAQYESIPGVGHAPFIEKPAEFNRILKKHLRGSKGIHLQTRRKPHDPMDFNE